MSIFSSFYYTQFGLIFDSVHLYYKTMAVKDNAHYLNSPMEFNKIGYICYLDTTEYDKMKKNVGVTLLIV